ncbi:MAG: cobalt-precorrin 5A hydrolase [Firmicutes bacterium]|nr:cobalt-precorrin 5A hydrolase [Bacillota bacterium]
MAGEVLRQGAGEVGDLAVVALTPAGKALAGRLAAAWNEAGGSARVYHPSSSLGSLVRTLWGRHEGLVFVMAVGIVVRVLAPLLRDKWRDPAVVVVDEGGRFAVSLLGGHWGGANGLARRVAALLGAVPVVTTATDVQGKTAVDLLARQWGFLPVPREGVKAVNRALLEGKRLVFYTEWQLPAEGEAPPFDRVRPLREGPGPGPGNPEEVPVFVTSREVSPLPAAACCLCPPSLAAGIGCRRGVSAGEIEAALAEACRRAGRRRESLGVLATHSAKLNERGLREAARSLGVPLFFFTSQILQGILDRVPGLRDVEFVRRQMGVGNVCETAALAAVPEGTLVLPKLKLGRVTVALAEAGLLWSASGREMRRI